MNAPSNPTPESEAARIIAAMRATVEASETHWFLALAEAIRAWPLPAEDVGGRAYRYLIAGEAFDWLLLAERLCDEIEDLIPEDEVHGLLFHGQLPIETGEEDLQHLLGAKYRAHLNFVYGVQVEEALQLAVLREVRKEHASRVWDSGHTDDETCTRIYGATRATLLAEWRRACLPEHPGVRSQRRAAKPAPAENEGGAGEEQPSARDSKELDAVDTLSLTALDEFTYWLFRHRVNNHDPARVASDTRKGMATLEELTALRRRAARVAVESA